MTHYREYVEWLKQTIPLQIGFLLVIALTLAPRSPAWGLQTVCNGVAPVNNVTDICNKGTNSCAGGIATINEKVCIQHGAILDFSGAGFPTVIVANGGELQLEDKTLDDLNGPNATCPTAQQSSIMTILAGDLTIQTGGSINSDVGDISGTMNNAGAIYINLAAIGTTLGNLIIEPGGRWSADRFEKKGIGRGGNLTAIVEGQIFVQGLPGPFSDRTKRGVISANTQSASRNVFESGCGRTEITLVALGVSAPASEAIRIDGIVEIASPRPSFERFLGGIIRLLAGSDASVVGTIPPFPSPEPVKDDALPTAGLPANPPDNGARVVIGGTGLVNVDAKDAGGGEVRIFGCFILIQGLVQAGGNATSGEIKGRENLLPVIILAVANEALEVRDGGRVFADIRQGYLTHQGQGPLCNFTPVSPAINNGPIGNAKGGADICLIGRREITLDGSALGANFAVSANTFEGGGQVGGSVIAMTTQLPPPDEAGNITFLANAITASGTGNGGTGGRIRIQANQNDIDVNGVVQASGKQTGGSIQVESVNGDIIGTLGGVLRVLPIGLVTLRECANIPGNNPPTDPPAIAAVLPPSCGTPVLITDFPILLPCTTAQCFCLNRFRVRNNILTIDGEHLTQVRLVEFNAGCNPDAGGDQVAPPFLSQSDSQIRIDLTGLNFNFTNRNVILSNPGPDGIPNTADDLGPSSSCSLELLTLP